jgi:ubiquinone biosynthesis protein COQ4
MDDVPYLMRGIKPIGTASSVLVSSSKYLNNPRLREWVATELLRRNGSDVPTPSGAYQLNAIMKEIQDYTAVDVLFAEERKKWPALDRWFQERYIPTYTRDDLKKYPPGSVGGIYYRHLSENNYQVDIVPRFEPKGDFEYWSLRSVLNHDMEHILGGGGFDSIGELVPGFLKLAYLYKFFSPDLANELGVKQFFLSFRFISRTALHYPECWQATWDAIDRGRRVGESSDAFFLARYEDIFHLTPEAARAQLGIGNVVEFDTAAISRIWDGAAPAPSAAA